MSLSLAVLFGMMVLVCYGVQDFLVAIVSRKIGIFRNSFWYLSIQLALLIVLALFWYSPIYMSAAIIGLIILTGLLWAAGLILFTRSLIEGNISVVVAITSAWGAVTAILGIIFFHESLSGLQAFYISLVILGTILLSFDLNGFLRGIKGVKKVGMSYALPAMVIYGVTFFLSSVLAKLLGWFDATLFITPPIVIFMFIYGMIRKESLKVSISQLPSLALMGCLGLIGFFAYNIGTEYNFTSIVAPISAASPLITVILATVIVREKLSGNQFVGIALVIMGLALLAL